MREHVMDTLRILALQQPTPEEAQQIEDYLNSRIRKTPQDYPPTSIVFDGEDRMGDG